MAVREGCRPGVRSGVRDGANAAIGATRYPAGPEWGANYTIQTPSGLWTMQEGAGSTQAEDSIGSNPLIDVGPGSYTFGVAAEGGRTALRFDAVTCSFAVADETWGDMTSSFSVWGRVYCATTTTGNRVLWGKYGSPDPRWYHNADTANVRHRPLIDDGTTSLSGTSAPHAGSFNAWVDIFTVLDFTNDEMRRTDANGTTIDSISTINKANVTPINVGFHLGESEAGTSASGINFHYAYLAAWDGYALTAADISEIQGYNP